MSSEKLKTYTENLTNEVKNGANAVVPVIESKVAEAKNLVDGALNSAYKAVDNAFGNSNLAKLEERFHNVKSIKKADVVIQETEKDWRLRLSLPSTFRKQASEETDLLAPLTKTNGMVFPGTSHTETGFIVRVSADHITGNRREEFNLIGVRVCG